MSRLPTPGQDNGNWGEILNDFLEQSHNDDGTLKEAAIPKSTDVTTDGDSDDKVPSVKAVKTYTDDKVGEVNTQLAANTNAIGELQNTGVDTVARADVSDLKSARNENRIKYFATRTTIAKARMTIVDDDARAEVYTLLKPLSESKGVPFVIAAPITYPSGTSLTDEQMLYLQNTLGWEIASHTYTHPNLRVETDASVQHELIDSKKELESRGFVVKNIVYPFGSGEGGSNSAYVKELSAQYYNCGANVGGGVNTIPISSFKIGRIPLGSAYAAGQGTYAYYQSKVDEAIASNGWVVFMTHCYNAQFDATQQQALSDLIDYALAHDVEIVTLQQGYEQMGNRVEVEGGYTVGVDGVSREPNNYKQLLSSTITGDTLITGFLKGSVTRRAFSNAGKGTLPEAGTLETFRPFSEDDYAYQTLYGYYNNVYYRRWINTGGWQAWQQLALKRFYSVTVDCGSIDAGKMKNFNLSVYATLPTLGVRSVVMAHPNTNANVASEIMISNSGYRVYLLNTHTSELTVGSVTFNVMVISET